METIKVLKSPDSDIPGTNISTSNNIRALITKVNKPRVIRLIGKVIITTIGLIMALIKAKRKAAKMATLISSTQIKLVN